MPKVVELKLSSRATVAIWSGGTPRAAGSELLRMTSESRCCGIGKAGGWEPLRNGDRISVMEATESQWKVVLIPGLTPREPPRSLNVVQRITISGGEQT
jgi:hypothetical protein